MVARRAERISPFHRSESGIHVIPAGLFTIVQKTSESELSKVLYPEYNDQPVKYGGGNNMYLKPE